MPRLEFDVRLDFKHNTFCISSDDHFDDHFDTNFTDTPASKSAEKESGIKPKRKRGRPPKSQAEKDATPIREDTKRAKWLLTRRPNESGTFQ